MKKEIRLYGWHGCVDKAFGDKIKELFPNSEYSKLDNCYYLTDKTLGEFADTWDDKFICFKRDDHWLIGLTQHNSFNQR